MDRAIDNINQMAPTYPPYLFQHYPLPYYTQPTWAYGYDGIPVRTHPGYLWPQFSCLPSPILSEQSHPVKLEEVSPEIPAPDSPRVEVQKKEKLEQMLELGRGKGPEQERQKYGRNIFSNIFRTAIKKILSNNFSPRITQAIAAHRLVITPNEFRSKLLERSGQFNSYINGKSMRHLLVGHPIGATRLDMDFRKLLRILIRIYLHMLHIAHIFNTGKIRKESRGLHLQTMRRLLDKICRPGKNQF